MFELGPTPGELPIGGHGEGPIQGTGEGPMFGPGVTSEHGGGLFGRVEGHVEEVLV